MLSDGFAAEYRAAGRWIEPKHKTQLPRLPTLLPFLVQKYRTVLGGVAITSARNIRRLEHAVRSAHMYLGRSAGLSPAQKQAKDNAKGMFKYPSQTLPQARKMVIPFVGLLTCPIQMR